MANPLDPAPGETTPGVVLALGAALVASLARRVPPSHRRLEPVAEVPYYSRNFERISYEDWILEEQEVALNLRNYEARLAAFRDYFRSGDPLRLQQATGEVPIDSDIAARASLDNAISPLRPLLRNPINPVENLGGGAAMRDIPFIEHGVRGSIRRR